MFGVRVCKGTSRRVFLFLDRYAIKIARSRIREVWYYRRWSEVLEGVKANRSEAQKWNFTKDTSLCPILYFGFGGIILVMPYARPLTDAEFSAAELAYITEGSSPFGRQHHGDFKRENYGVFCGRTVRVDYE